MGSFQLTYDDFSGGQYMGNSQNPPKNKWFGKNCISSPDGQLLSSGSLIASTTAGATSDSAQIMDMWVLGNSCYSFVQYLNGATYSPYFIKTIVNNGVNFPVTSTSTALSGIKLSGEVAWVPSVSLFFYIDIFTSGYAYIRKISTAGVDASSSTTLVGITGLTNLILYNYRLVAYGPANKSLYFSNTDYTWSLNNYLTFAGRILKVITRTSDLIVLTDVGVYSVTGVLGSTTSIQLIIPQEGITEGMVDATIVGRTPYFLDQQLVGSLDGSIYSLQGSQSRKIATLQLSDVSDNAVFGVEQARVRAVNDGRMVVQFRNGVAYAETSLGVWSRFTNSSWPTVEKSLTKQTCVAKSGQDSLNEYFISGAISTATLHPFSIHRYIHNTPSGSYLDQDFVYTTTAASASNLPTSSVTLSEYFHSKPFVVKEVFVEYVPVYSTAQVSATITPTGSVGVTAAQLASGVYSTTQTLTSASSTSSVFQSFLPNNAVKGFGCKISLSFKAAAILRIILNCEE